MQSLFNVYKNWAIYKINYNYVKSEDNCFLFSLQATKTFLEHSKRFMVGRFCQKS